MIQISFLALEKRRKSRSNMGIIYNKVLQSHFCGLAHKGGSKILKPTIQDI